MQLYSLYANSIENSFFKATVSINNYMYIGYQPIFKEEIRAKLWSVCYNGIIMALHYFVFVVLKCDLTAEKCV